MMRAVVSRETMNRPVYSDGSVFGNTPGFVGKSFTGVRLTLECGHVVETTDKHAGRNGVADCEECAAESK